jgi:hypothetical protein
VKERAILGDSLQPRGDEEQPVLSAGNLGDVGSGFAALLGHAPAELTRRPLEDLAHGEDRARLSRRLLPQCGARVFAAGSARAGLAVLERERPDILVCDISMPEEDGYAFVHRVRGLAPERGGHAGRDPERARALGGQ